MNKTNKKYDLEERTAKLAEDVIVLVKTIKHDAVNRRIISQLVLLLIFSKIKSSSLKK